MRNIKLFEMFNIRENTKDDIFGIFVELEDIGYKIEVDIDQSTSGDQIYICISKDEFNYDSSSFENNILKIYYPFLYSKNIHSLEELNESREDLI